VVSVVSDRHPPTTFASLLSSLSLEAPNWLDAAQAHEIVGLGVALCRGVTTDRPPPADVGGDRPLTTAAPSSPVPTALHTRSLPDLALVLLNQRKQQ